MNEVFTHAAFGQFVILLSLYLGSSAWAACLHIL